MRELLLKNMISKDKKRSELFLFEHFEKDGFIQDFEKKTVYHVTDILQFTDTVDIELFLAQKKKENKPVQTFIVKHRDTRHGVNKFVYKVIGEQYVILADKVFILQVTQSIKRTVRVKKPLLKNA